MWHFTKRTGSRGSAPHLMSLEQRRSAQHSVSEVRGSLQVQLAWSTLWVPSQPGQWVSPCLKTEQKERLGKMQIRSEVSATNLWGWAKARTQVIQMLVLTHSKGKSLSGREPGIASPPGTYPSLMINNWASCYLTKWDETYAKKKKLPTDVYSSFTDELQTLALEMTKLFIR